MPPTPARARARREPLAGRILALLDCLSDGESLPAMTAAKRLGVSLMEVANACWANGLELPGIPNPVAKLAPLMSRGISFRELHARAGGMTAATIRAVCARAGWEVPK